MCFYHLMLFTSTPHTGKPLHPHIPSPSPLQTESHLLPAVLCGYYQLKSCTTFNIHCATYVKRDAHILCSSTFPPSIFPLSSCDGNQKTNYPPQPGTQLLFEYEMRKTSPNIQSATMTYTVGSHTMLTYRNFPFFLPLCKQD